MTTNELLYLAEHEYQRLSDENDHMAALIIKLLLEFIRGKIIDE